MAAQKKINILGNKPSLLDQIADKALRNFSDDTTLGDVANELQIMRNRIELLIRALAPTDTYTEIIPIQTTALIIQGTVNGSLIVGRPGYTIVLYCIIVTNNDSIGSAPATPSALADVPYRIKTSAGSAGHGTGQRRIIFNGRLTVSNPQNTFYPPNEILLFDSEGLEYDNQTPLVGGTTISANIFGHFIKTIDIKKGMIRQ